MNKETEQQMKIEKLENHLRHWKKVAETEETKVRKLKELNGKLQKEVGKLEELKKAYFSDDFTIVAYIQASVKVFEE